MKYTVSSAALFLSVVILSAVPGGESSAQALSAAQPLSAEQVQSPQKALSAQQIVNVMQAAPGQAVYRQQVSRRKALGLSMLLPGLGHRYVHGGDWDGWASVFAIADASLWAALLGSEWRRNHLIDSYTAFASVHADADVGGKGRDFFLNLASYMSSDEYTEVQLRNRNWGQIGFADEPSFQWDWDSEDNYAEYRRIREDAESLRRRRTFIITSLVANRLISGITALRAAGRANDEQAELSFGVPPLGSSAPLARLTLTF